MASVTHRFAIEKWLGDTDGPLGHLEGIVSIAKASDAIRRLLAE